MFIQTVKDPFQRLLGDFEVPFNRMGAIHEHFWLDNRHQVAFLAKRTNSRIVVLAASVGATPQAEDYLALFDDNITALLAAAVAVRR